MKRMFTFPLSSFPCLVFITITIGGQTISLSLTSFPVTTVSLITVPKKHRINVGLYVYVKRGYTICNLYTTQLGIAGERRELHTGK